MNKRAFFSTVAAAALLCTAGAARSLPTEGVTPDEIRIGASVVLSGPLGAQTADYGTGARLYFDFVNAGGGVNGRRIVYKTLDDGFDVQRAVKNTRQLLEQDKVFLIFNNTGTAQTAAFLPYTTEQRTVVFGPVTGATSLRDKYNRYLFHVRASYADEAATMARHLKQVGISRVAVFHEENGLGKTLLAEMEKAAQAQGLQVVAKASVDPRKPAFDEAASAVARAEPQALVMCSAGATFTGMAAAMQKTGARPVTYGFSVVSPAQITRDLGPASRGTVLAQIMPSMANSANPAVAEFLALAKKTPSVGEPSPSKLEGFVHAKVLVEGLKRAGRNLDTESFVNALERAGEMQYGKFALHFTPQSHNGSNYVELAIIDGAGKLRY